MSYQIIVPDETHKLLRELRAWHWREAKRHMAVARETTSGEANQHFSRMADTHVKFVQTLNEFFPIGDGADKDVKDPTGFY